MCGLIKNFTCLWIDFEINQDIKISWLIGKQVSCICSKFSLIFSRAIVNFKFKWLKKLKKRCICRKINNENFISQNLLQNSILLGWRNSWKFHAFFFSSFTCICIVYLQVTSMQLLLVMRIYVDPKICKILISWRDSNDLKASRLFDEIVGLIWNLKKNDFDQSYLNFFNFF